MIDLIYQFLNIFIEEKCVRISLRIACKCSHVFYETLIQATAVFLKLKTKSMDKSLSK